MNFCWSTLKVKNMEESLRFYRDLLGLKVDKKFNAGQGTEIVFLGNGETKIELICDESKKDIDVGQDISWGFEIESVDDMLKLVKEKGIKVLSDPIQPNPHIKFFYISDPNGFKIQLVENM